MNFYAKVCYLRWGGGHSSILNLHLESMSNSQYMTHNILV